MNLRDWIPSGSGESWVGCSDRCTPVEYPSPYWCAPFGSLSPSRWQGIGLGQSEAFLPFSAGRQRARARGPQPIRGLPAIRCGECCRLLLSPLQIEVRKYLGVSLGFLLKQIPRAGAVGSTDRLLGHLSSQGRRLPLGPSGRLL